MIFQKDPWNSAKNCPNSIDNAFQTLLKKVFKLRFTLGALVSSEEVRFVFTENTEPNWIPNRFCKSGKSGSVQHCVGSHELILSSDKSEPWPGQAKRPGLNFFWNVYHVGQTTAEKKKYM